MGGTIGKYKIVREVGKGGMGIVYKGFDPTAQKHVAIKVLPPSMVDRSTVERFTREAHVLARLKHPNLVEVLDIGITENKHYLVMEFVDGESLKSVIKRKGRLSEPEALEVLDQTAQALAYIHREGIIHRDIKPGNIMINKEGRVKLMDFGLVHIPGVTRLTVEGSTVGTAEYMSPEQFSDEMVDSRTDIYSLGITLYEMLTGSPPFQGDNFQAVLMKHKTEVPKPIKPVNPSISPELEQIAIKSIAKKVAYRYQRVEDILAEVRKLRGQNPVPAPNIAAPGSEAQSSPLLKKQRSGVPALIILIVALAMAAGGWWVWDQRETAIPKLRQLYSKALGSVKLKKETEGHMLTMESAETHQRKGMQFFGKGKIDAAIREFQRAVEMRPDYAPYYSDLAFAYEEKNEYEKAIQAWNDLLKYDQTGPLAKKARDQILKIKDY